MHKRPKATFYKRASKAARVDLCGILLGDVGDVVVEGDQNIYMAQEAEREVPEAMEDYIPSGFPPEQDHSLDGYASSQNAIEDLHSDYQVAASVRHDGSGTSMVLNTFIAHYVS